MQKLSARSVTDALEPKLRERIAQVKAKQGRVPKLAVIIVGEDPASVIYTTQKGKRATELGMEHVTHTLPVSIAPSEVKGLVQKLNEDATIDGILIQRPLPPSFREEDVLYWVSPDKDVDAFHPINTSRLSLGLSCFKPCTPLGIMRMLAHYGVDPSGKIACVIGRSAIVGKPVAALLLQANATVIQAHSKTPNLIELARQADILVVAAGRPRLIDERYFKAGAVVIDVGVHRNAQGKVVGDVAYDPGATLASAISPVPGGVGPMTIAMLMENTVWSAEQRG